MELNTNTIKQLRYRNTNLQDRNRNTSFSILPAVASNASLNYYKNVYIDKDILDFCLSNSQTFPNSNPSKKSSWWTSPFFSLPQNSFLDRFLCGRDFSRTSCNCLRSASKIAKNKAPWWKWGLFLGARNILTFETCTCITYTSRTCRRIDLNTVYQIALKKKNNFGRDHSLEWRRIKLVQRYRLPFTTSTTKLPARFLVFAKKRIPFGRISFFQFDRL